MLNSFSMQLCGCLSLSVCSPQVRRTATHHRCARACADPFLSLLSLHFHFPQRLLLLADDGAKHLHEQDSTFAAQIHRRLASIPQHSVRCLSVLQQADVRGLNSLLFGLNLQHRAALGRHRRRFSPSVHHSCLRHRHQAAARRRRRRLHHLADFAGHPQSGRRGGPLERPQAFVGLDRQPSHHLWCAFIHGFDLSVVVEF